MIKQQWFVKMDEMIKPAVKAVKEGEIKLLPERMDKIYFNWTDNIRDWCISSFGGDTGSRHTTVQIVENLLLQEKIRANAQNADARI